MKKKLIIGVLALSMCFSFASCVDRSDSSDNTPGSSTSETGYDVAAAAEVLYDTLVDKNEETLKDYTVPNTLNYLNTVYKITWSVDVTEGVELTVGETETKVVVNKNAQADIPYVLTAVVADPDGKTETVTFERKVLQAPALTPEAITAKPVENQAYKLYVYQATKSADCYFTGKMSGFYYATDEDYTNSIDVYVEYKEGSETEFYLTFEDNTDGKQYITIQEGWNNSSSHWTFNPVITSEATTTFTYSEQYETIIATIFARSEADYKNHDAAPSVNTSVYLGNYSTYMTFSVSEVSRIGGSGNNVGNLVEMIDKNNIAPEKKVATVKDTLSVQADHRMNKQIELPTYDERFADVTISWALSETTAATLSEDGKLSLTIPTEAATVTLTATITCGDTSDTKEFTLNLGPAIVLGSNPTEAEIVDAAFSLATGEALANEYTLSGKITKINTPYSAEYNNITVTISVANKEIECFRLNGDGIATLKVGDTIEVKGTIKNYNGTVEFDSGCTLVSVTPGENPTPDVPVDGTVSISIADIADANGWVDATIAEKIEYQGVTVTHSATAVGDYGQNTGKYYENGENWRFYQNENPTITISAADGKQIATVKITYASNNSGCLTKDGANIKSDDLVVVNGTSVSFGVGNTGTANNGQARITAITVVFGESDGETPNPGPGGDETPSDPTYSLITAAPSSNTVYNLYVYQTSLAKDCFFTGEMNGFYFATTTDQTAAVEVYVEYTADGTAFNLFFMKDNVRQYIGVRVSGTYNNIVFDNEPVSQFVWNEQLKTITTEISSGTFYLGNYNTFNTISASKIDKAATSNVGGLYATSKTVDKLPGSVTTPDQGGDETPDQGSDNASVLVEGKAYTFYVAKDGKTYYVNGNINESDTGNKLATTETESEAAKLYVEVVEGGYKFYLLDGTAKKYIHAYTDTNSKKALEYSETDSSVFFYNEEKKSWNVTMGTVNVSLIAYKNETDICIANLGSNTPLAVKEAPETTPDEGGDETPATELELSFANTANRLSQDDNSQVWEQNGVKLTNNKAASTSNVADTSNPVRLYASSSVTIECEGMKKIVFNCAGGKNLNASDIAADSNVTVTVNGNVVTIEFTNAVDSFEIAKLSGQVRLSSLTVTKA